MQPDHTEYHIILLSMCKGKRVIHVHIHTYNGKHCPDHNIGSISEAPMPETECWFMAELCK